jgi:hypothetical protein
VLFAAALSKRAIFAAGEGGEHGNIQTERGGDKRRPQRWVEGIVGGCGPDGPGQRPLLEAPFLAGHGLPVEVAGLGVVGLLLQSVHLNAKGGFRDRGLVLLRQVEMALLLKTRASIVLTQSFELGPLLGELLGETALRGNAAGPRGLLVLRAGRRRVGNLTPLECLVEAVELRKNEFAAAVVLGACVRRLQVCARVGSSAA